MRKVATTYSVNNEYVDFTPGTRNGTLYGQRWLNNVQTDLIKIQEAAGLAEGDGSEARVLAGAVKVFQDRKMPVGVAYESMVYREPAAFDYTDLDAYFNGICLDAVDGSEEISEDNWPDLVPVLRSVVMRSHGVTEFSCVVVGNVVTLTNTVASSGLLSAIENWNDSFKRYEEILTVSIDGSLYEVAGVDSASRTILTIGNPPQGSGAAVFYPNRLVSDNTKCRIHNPLNAEILDNWEEQTIATSETINGIYYSEFYGEFFVVGNNGVIYRSSDGSSWSSNTSGTTEPLYGVYGTTSPVIAVGGSGTAKILSGGSWIDFWTGETTATLFSCIFTVSKSIAVGTNGTGIYDNSEFSIGFANSIRDVMLIGDRIIIVGDGGMIAYSDDNAASWVFVSSGVTDTLNAITHSRGKVAVDGLIIVAVGSNGAIVRSLDCGESWDAVDSGSSSDINAVCSIDRQFVAVGDNGLILVSESSGYKWGAHTSPVSDSFFAVQSNGEYIVACGADGTIIRTEIRSNLLSTPFYYKYLHGGRYVP